MNKPHSFSELIPSLSETLELEKKTAHLAVIDLWQTMLQNTAPQYVSFTEAIKVITKKTNDEKIENILLVSVSDALIASNMQFICDSLCNALNDYTPQTGVTINGIQMQVRKRI